MPKSIYMDNAATTMVAPEVLAEMMPYFSEKYGNASSPHLAGIEARNAVDDGRARVARALGCEDGEIIFTSCGSESDNLAIVGGARANRGMGKHIITCTIEHPAVLNTCDGLMQEGFEVTHVPVT
ncbi:MAG: aminotransferase class V-fold PLP-dependent enzyme, partial [Candidatus Micrarchaeota archaeon]|nr:aminotransferase class V-fold PLP-dependent enzyme [Candidatus Micrarchaeota archaeon]